MEKENTPRLDVRIKIIILIVINLISVINDNITIEIITMGVILLCSCYSKLYRKALQFTSFYLLMLGIFYISSTHDNIVSAIFLVFCLVIRILIPVFFFGYCIIATTKVSEMLIALRMFGLPRSITIPFSVILSYLPSLSIEFRQISDAMKMRGFGLSLRNIILHPLRSTENIMVPLIIRSTTIAEEISAAAITRGIESEEKRTSYYPMKIKGSDILFLSLFTIILAICIYANYFSPELLLRGL